jgi:endonuclease YncB( thermonuclease family)
MRRVNVFWPGLLLILGILTHRGRNRAAKTRLAELVSQGGVSCTPHGYDRYGRTLAVCSAGNIPDLGEMLVREGYAMNFALGHSGYPAAEREAQSARRGVWQGEYESPRNWRRRHPRAG